ncbi:ABC transporter ATP-binding protein [Hamadaea tsunoensis]|uniref:hypothetical protein n=1 Tax=Hamadaea tsunoensis TaxID=53368 RepID=UPI000426BC12|nr:hypothetical protein [Hamadaea tsunoensis]
MNTAEVQAPAIAEDAENTGTAEEPAAPTPVLVARGLGLSEPVTVYPGEIVALAGPPNSGRTAALLSLAGNYAQPRRPRTTPNPRATPDPRAGSGCPAEPVRITVSHVIKAQDSGDLPDPNRIKGADPAGAGPGARGVALGLVRNAYEPEPMLTGRDHLAERLRLLRPLFRRTRRELDERAAALPFDPRTLARDLSPLQRHELMLHVALISDPGVILIDDLDLGLTPAEQATLIEEISAAGRAAVVTMREGN